MTCSDAHFTDQVGEMDPMTKELLSTTDVTVWAKHFAATAKTLYDVDMDEGWLIGWFANAMEMAKNEMRREAERCSPDKPCPKVNDWHVIIYGECFVASYDRYISLSSEFGDKAIVAVEPELPTVAES